MKKIFKDIDDYKHIVITIDDINNIGYIASANALYTYLLQLHKKVSLYAKSDKLGLNISFLPWINKLRTSYPSSSDIEIKAISTIDMFEYFEENTIYINHKMATSLYAGLLYETKGFKINLVKNIFIMAQKLLECGADIEICTKNILNYQPLCVLRLKSILLKKMILKEEATLAVFEISDDDLQKSGANIDDVVTVVDEALSLPTVTKTVVIYNNT